MIRTTWILIASSSEARLFQAEKTTKDMKLIHEFTHPESRKKVTSLVTGSLGRYRKMNSTPIGLFAEPTDPKEVEAEHFAHELASKLNDGRNKNLYKNLVVIAPAHFQGLLNKFFNTHVKNLIIVTLHKDFTKLKPHELLNHLNGKIHLRQAA